MKMRRFSVLLFLGLFIAASFAVMMPKVVYADCGLPGQPPCPPSGGDGGGGKKRKTPLPPKITATSAMAPTQPHPMLMPISGGGAATVIPTSTKKPPTATPTDPAWHVTYEACWKYAYLTAEAQTPGLHGIEAEYTADAAGSICYATLSVGATLTAKAPTVTPTATQCVLCPPVAVRPTKVAGPVFLRPGVINVIIAVLIIIGIAGGLIIVLRGVKPPSG